MRSEPLPISCTLSPIAAGDQLLEWTELQGHATDVVALPAGARMRFPAELEPVIADLVSREVACCAFLDIKPRLTGGDLVVEVTSQNPDALPVISMLVGLPLS